MQETNVIHPERFAAHVREHLPPSALLNVPDAVIDSLAALLFTPSGKDLISRLVDDLARPAPVRLERWWSERLEPHSVVTDSNFKAQVGAAMRPVLDRLTAASGHDAKAVTGPAGLGAIGIAVDILKGLAGQNGYTVPVQVIEALDDIKSISGNLASTLGKAPVDGVVAALLGAAISASLNTLRYRKGGVRWDDAIDNVVCDTVKAGLTGILVSALAGSLAIAPPAAIVVVVLVSPIIYAVVSSAVDFVYQRLLGGDQIVAARKAHLDYLQTSAMIQRDFVPRIRRLNQVGALIGVMGNLTFDAASKRRVLSSSRSCLASFTTNMESEEALRNAHGESETYLLARLAPRIKKPALCLATKPVVTAAEIAHLARRVHDVYWASYAIDSGFRRIPPDEVFKSVAVSEHLESHGGDRYDTIKSVIVHLAELEKSRPSPEEPILFRTKWEGAVGKSKKVEEYKVFASDFLDLCHTLLAMKNTSWPWSTELGDDRVLLDGSIEAIKADAQPLGVVDYEPKKDGFFNRFYRKELTDDLLSGRARLFQYANPNVRSECPLYLATTASDESEDKQCKELQGLLRRLHPAFRDSHSVLASLRPVSDVPSFLANESPGRSTLHLHGLNVLCLEKYTATYEVESPSETEFGEVHCVAVEGYFRTLAEAKEAFGGITVQHRLKGVRPGPRVLSDTLRHQLRVTPGNDYFLLQNQLIGRLGEGLIALDRASNLSEANIAKLAGVGVFVSWWWSLSGHTRRELVNAIRDAELQQAIRIELMEALLEVQRAHILSHPCFADTLLLPHARHMESVAEEAKRAIEKAPKDPKSDG